MKKMLPLAAGLIMMLGCQRQTGTPAADNDRMDGLLAVNDDVTPRELVKDEHTEMYGVWTGFMEVVYDNDEEFSDDDYRKKLSIKIKRIEDDVVYGKSITAGHARNLEGTYKIESDIIVVKLNEPGTNKYDGIFELRMVNDSLKGTFKPFKKNEGIGSLKNVALVRAEFKYDPKVMLTEEEIIDYTNPKIEKWTVKNKSGETFTRSRETFRVSSEEIMSINSSTTKLTESQLKNLRKIDLEILRYTIYARHGLTFKKSYYRYFFESTDWYVPISDNVDADLTKLEKENIALLQRMEKYAEDHYDYFGR